jgi:hypothetical protein
MPWSERAAFSDFRPPRLLVDRWGRQWSGPARSRDLPTGDWRFEKQQPPKPDGNTVNKKRRRDGGRDE